MRETGPGVAGPAAEQFALAAQQITEAVVFTDARRRVTWVNAGFERMSGWTMAEMVGRSPGEVLQCERTDPATVARMRAALDAGQAFSGEILNRDRHGREYWLDIRIHPIHDAGGTLTGYVAIESDATERRAAADRAHAREAFLDTVGRIGGIGGWSIDPRRGTMEWTDQTYRIFDLPMGTPVTIADLVARCAPSHRATLQQALAQAQRPGDGTDWDLEAPFLTARGKRIWARVVAETQYDDGGPVRVVGALQDITQQRATKAEAVRNAALLRGAIDAIDEAFVLYDPDDRLVLHNEKYLQMYETSRDLLVPGARFEDVIREGARRGQYKAAIGRVEDWVQERMAQHRSGDTTLEQRLDNGRIVRVVERRMPDGHLVGFRVDITDLVQAREAARLADEAKTEFIATISHELRTPLQSIIGFSELGVHFAAGHDQFRTMFEHVQSGGRRMLTLVNSLLDVSRIDGTIGSLSLHRCDLRVLVDEVLQETAPLAARGRLVVRGPDDDGAPLAIDGDAFRCQQVVRNVLANAIRFSPADSTIEVDATRHADGRVVLAVSDRGPGIPEDELESIFEPFVQSSRTRDGSGGTGLGLAICRRIMGAHGGAVTAANRPGGGARIEMTWPAPTSRTLGDRRGAVTAGDLPAAATVFERPDAATARAEPVGTGPGPFPTSARTT